MVRIAKVQLINVNTSEVYLWIRKNLKLPPKVAKLYSRNGHILDFQGEMDEAVEFFEWCCGCNNHVRIIIDCEVSTISRPIVNCFAQE